MSTVEIIPSTKAPRGAGVVFATLLIGYASLYLCRANVESALPYFQKEYGYDKEKLGLVSSIAIGCYAIGKVVLGSLTEIVGGRKMFLFAIFASVVASLGIGVSPVFVLIAALICANRFVQAGGWSALVDVVSRWFPRAGHGAVMGGLSTSYEIGNVVALLLSSVVAARLGWRALFVVNPILLGVVGLVAFFTLKGAPATPLPGTRDAPGAAPKPPVGRVVGGLLRQRAMQYALFLSFLLTFVRQGFLNWSPTFLAEIGAHEANAVPVAIAKSAVFPAAGMIGAVVVGKWSDRFGRGRRAPTMALSLALLVASLLWLAHVGVANSHIAIIAVGACGLFLLGPYSLLAGAVSLDVADEHGAGAAAGLMDGVGYVGGTLAPLVMGAIAKRHGWTAVFDTVAAVAAIACVTSMLWARRNPAPREA